MLVFRIVVIGMMLFPSLLFAQNSFFFPFGVDMNEVQNSLVHRNYYRKIEVQKTKSQLIAYYENNVITYNFKDSALYEMEMYKTVPKKTDYKLLLENCQGFMKRSAGDFFNLAEEGNYLRCAHVSDAVLYELKGEAEKNSFNVYLRKTSRNHGPKFQIEAYVIQLKGEEEAPEAEGSE